MRFSLLLVQTLVLSCCPTLGFQADIRADSNRDGIIDLDGDTDLADKLSSSNNAGSIFLANIGDTDRRCSKLALLGKPLSNEELSACHDASDDIQRSPQFMAPLRTIPIPNLSPDASGSVAIHDPIARDNVRIFLRENSDWVITSNEYNFTSSQLENGLELGIDARDTRRPGGWDGRVTVQFTVRGQGQTSVDALKLRVAPILTHHHAQPVLEILTTAGNSTFNFFQERFVSDFEAALDRIGIDSPLFQFNASDDIWAQDFVEPGYTSMPGPNGPITLQVMFRSAQDDRVAGRQVFEYLRSAGRGAVQHIGGARNEINSMGNLETIPPYKHNGKEYPAGRIILGAQGSLTPYILDYLQAQELQQPLLLDTDWLAVGHVDEFVQFLPSNNSLGWVMLVSDPLAGLEILQGAKSAGHGQTRAFSRSNDTEGDPASLLGVPGGLDGVPSYTIDDLLSDTHLIASNKNFSARITENISLLQRETGITDADIHRVPTVFRTGLTFPPGLGIESARNGSSDLGGALYPTGINGVVLNNKQYLAPKPWGPMVGGRDILADAISAVYEKLDFKVSYVDNWNSHHAWGGEVHCGTNTIREAGRWW
ncbi:hypothetical protein FQN52_004376 [Onygenales sp. PD_12]|nr:hypothetical protein FQN52_004376 [Onygenales sp. PD_12]